MAVYLQNYVCLTIVSNEAFATDILFLCKQQLVVKPCGYGDKQNILEHSPK